MPATEEGHMVFCFPSLVPGPRKLSLVRDYLTNTHIPGRPCSLLSSLHTLASHPGSVFPAKSPERTWPEVSLSEADRQVLQISGLSEKVAQVSQAPEGHPWLAGWHFTPSTSSCCCSFTQPGRQETADPFPPPTCLRQPLGI